MYDFTPMDFPDGVDLYVRKRPESRGFDVISSRSVVGDVEHITRTNGQIEHVHKLVSAGGLREDDLLLDAVIGRDGRIGYFNGPFLTDYEARASWINTGPDAHLSPTAGSFISRFGTEGLGRYLLSKAHICREDQGLTDAQFEASARLSAAIHQQACCPWDQYPFNPLYGSVLSFWHCDFGFDACPGDLFQRRWARPLRERVRALLRAAQTGVVEGFTSLLMDRDLSIPFRYPAGWDADTARLRFGELEHCRADGTRSVLTFDPRHVVCCEWLRYGWLEGAWPEPMIWIEVQTAEDQHQDLVMFAGGSRLVRRGREQPWHWERLGDSTGDAQEEAGSHALGT